MTVEVRLYLNLKRCFGDDIADLLTGGESMAQPRSTVYF